MSFLRASGLAKHYQQQIAVAGLDFEVEQGQFVALLGPSGCGKSTTLNMLAGLEQPTRGKIQLQQQDITHFPPGQRQLSMVFQSYALFPHLSVQENILFGLKARKIARSEQQKRLKHALELVDLGQHMHKKPAQLSGGQCQRVALARSIVSQAPLCLMDEPLSNLDSKLRNEMRSEIRRLQQSLGLTVVYVTHDQVEAMSMADHIILLNRGKIEQQGSPESFYQLPQSTFVASFIGHPPMNLLPHAEGILGVRPEHIQLAERGHPVRVQHCDYQGPSTILNVSISDGPYRGADNVQFSVSGKQQLTSGSQLKINWDPNKEHSFCSTNGQRLASSYTNLKSAI